MFLPFYKLKEQPFGVTPDPRFLYLSPSHREAIASLYCGIENGRGFSALVAKPGMGKTSILFRLLETLKSRTRMAFLFQPDCNSLQFYQSLMLDLGLEVSNDIGRMRESLNRLLLEERGAGRRFVIVIDEAQNLSADILESVRLLSNFETSKEKLIHIILAGQPQLTETLARPDMVQLSQRVAAPTKLEPLSLEETRAYIRHRLGVAGHSGSDIFTDEAYTYIAQFSEGIPRNISSICFHAMSIGYALQIPKIHPGVIREVVNDLHARGEKAPNKTVSFENPAFDGAWSLPELPNIVPPPFERRRPWKLGFAMTALVLFPLFAWLIVNSRWKPNQWELPLKIEIHTPSADTQTPLPSASKEPTAAATSVAPSNPSTTVDNIATQAAGNSSSSEDSSENSVADAKFGQPPSNSTAPIPRSKETRTESPARSVVKKQAPRVIYTEKPETLFQVALENYGKSNWDLVNKIRIENPSFRDPYVVLAKGQRLFLPDVSASETGGKRNGRR